MWNDNYRWHFDYVRLACDAGFTFSTLKSHNSIEKSNIGILDIEQVIHSRDVGIVERFIPFVTQFKLDVEQTQVLDPNFVKLFQVSQLAIEYLNFCKMYLDNTVVLLKKELSTVNEDRNNLRICCNELKTHVMFLKKKSQEPETVGAHKCEYCSKMFSNEEFLFSHIKRRHESQIYQAETDKLQLEIKELKERLNNTEKTVHKDLNKEKVELLCKDLADTSGSNTKIYELQQKFEILKTHVESELKLLHTQKSFQDKYEKWFDIAFNNLMPTQSAINVHEVKGLDQQDVGNVEIKSTQKRDCAIQTRQLSPTVTNRVQPTCIASPSSRKGLIDFSEVQEKLSVETINHMSNFERILEQKLSGSMERIETQMNSFWNKLNELEQNKSIVIEEREQELHDTQSKRFKTINPTNYYSNLKVSQTIENKSVNRDVKNQKSNEEIKKDSTEIKYIKKKNPEDSIKSIVFNDDSSIRSHSTEHSAVPFVHTSIMEVPVKETIKTVQVMNTNLKGFLKKQVSTSKNISSDTETSESDKISSEQKVAIKPSNTSTLAKRSITSLKQAMSDGKIVKELEGEVEQILNNRLVEMGVSSHWSGIPKRTFNHCIRVVKHQATLTKKNYPEYFAMREEIIKSLQHQLLKPKKSKTKLVEKLNFSSNIKIVNNIPIVDSTTETMKQDKPKTVIEPKSMYEKDESSEEKFKKPPHSDDALSVVIQELKSVQEEKVQIQDQINKNETKSALKNYPSVGSLTRKKVLFDLESDSNASDAKHLSIIKPVDSGSTTSVASSVLDGSKVNFDADIEKESDKKVNSKDKDSDWDISDLLT